MGFLAWLVLALRAASHSRAEPRSATRSAAAPYLLMAAAELMRLFAMEGRGSLVGIGPGFQLAAGAVLVSVAGADLRTAYRGEEEQAAVLTRAIAELRGQLMAIESAERVRLHDARSALAGVIGASAMLDAARADVDHRQLRHLITRELHRLQGMLDTRCVEPIAEFDLAAALGPVVEVHRLDGQRISSDLGSTPVIGRPGATATVLDNLLHNAGRHAPHARVVVHTEVTGHTAMIVVEDDGPGIPEFERTWVLRAGVRGASARGEGDGLGLSSSVTAMAAQGGSLRLDRREGGGTQITLSLPIAASCDVLSGSR